MIDLEINSLKHRMESIYKRLKKARVQAGYASARYFANTHNISDSTYTQHESGKRKMSLSTLIFYAHLLKINSYWIITGIQKKPDDCLPSIFIPADKPNQPEKSIFLLNLQLLAKIYFFLTRKYQNLEIQYSILLNTSIVIYNSIVNNKVLLNNQQDNLDSILDNKFIKYTPLAKYRN
jgi:DNA-binding XRE family transcriptional regulator